MMGSISEEATTDPSPINNEKNADCLDDDDDPLCKVYVGHLTPHANETHVQDFFRAFGGHHSSTRFHRQTVILLYIYCFIPDALV
jgi:hypothetical protein